MDSADQRAIDAKMIDMDGTPNKANLGANAILGVSLAAAKAGAGAKGVPLYQHIADVAGNGAHANVLPVPAFNVINGGSHAGPAAARELSFVSSPRGRERDAAAPRPRRGRGDASGARESSETPFRRRRAAPDRRAGNKLAFQEYFIIPVGAQTFKEAIRIGAECYHNLSKILKKKFGGDATLIGDEGGFAPPCDARQGVELVMEAIKQAGYEGVCKVGMDVAASEFKVEGEDVYDLGTWYPEAEKTPELKMTGAQLGEFYASLAKDFPIITIEDPFDQDDWAAWGKMTASIGEPTQIVGDDLTVTNVTRVKKAIDDKSCNALLLKVNQIGSMTEAIDAVKMCKQSGWGVMCSHRSGETEDTTIADIAVGLCCGQIKTGAPCRSDRNAKYNQLMRIEEELGADAVYAGATWRKPTWMA